jgi:hypothetical protein
VIGGSDYSKHFISPQHAYLAGLVVGELRRHGVTAEPEIDDDGNYTDVLAVVVGPELQRVQLRVLPDSP